MQHKMTASRLAITSVLLFLASNVVLADHCPTSKDVFEKATKEGIGAQWDQVDKAKWYLDQFSNNNKPAETAANKFTFFQGNYENKQLTCYYEWPNDDGKSMNWLSVRLRTAQTVKPAWTGANCSNFEAENCEFTLEPTPIPTPAPK